MQASTVAQAQRSFSALFHNSTTYFQSAFAPGWTINEITNSANIFRCMPGKT